MLAAENHGLPSILAKDHLVKDIHTTLQWTLDHGSTTEGQTFYLTTRSGAFVLVQMVYSTMSWSPNVQISARFYGNATDTSNLPIQHKNQTYNHHSTAMHLSADRLSATCENMSIKLVKDEPVAYHVSFNAGTDFVIDFTMTSIVDGGKVVEIAPNGGRINFKHDDGYSGFVTSRFIPRAAVTGTIIIDGQIHDAAGLGCFVQAIQHYPQYCGRWSFANLQGECDSMILYQFEMPSGYGYAVDKCSQVCVVKDGKTVLVSMNNNAQHIGPIHDPASGYRYPSALCITANSAEDDFTHPAHMEVMVPLKHRLDQIDILCELPFLLRKFIQTFITKPYLYSWMEHVSGNMTIGNEQVSIKGDLFVETTFLVDI